MARSLRIEFPRALYHITSRGEGKERICKNGYFTYEWKWSSYLATIRKESRPNWLDIDKILCLFNKDVSLATQKYQEFVTAGIKSKSPWSGLKKQIYFGNDAFIMRC